MAENITLARPYAQALFDIAQQARNLDQWSAALNTLAQVMQDEAGQRYLASPGRTDKERVEFLTAIATGATAEDGLLTAQAGQNFLRLAAENGRLNVLAEIAARFDVLKAQAERTIEVSIVAASEIDDGLARRIAESLEKRLGRSIELKLSVDPGLVGGAVIRAEDQVIDGSVRSRLQSLSQALVS